MAKIKKLNGDAIKGFFVHNGEKLVLGFAVLCLLLFTISAWGRPGVPSGQEPTAIKNKAQQASSFINEGEIVPPESSVDVLALASRSFTKIPTSAVEITPYKPQVFKSFNKRGEPQLFTAENLIASAGRGVIGLAGPQTGLASGMAGMEDLSMRMSAPGPGPSSGGRTTRGRNPQTGSGADMTLGPGPGGTAANTRGRGRQNARNRNQPQLSPEEQMMMDEFGMEMMGQQVQEAPRTGLSVPGAIPDGRQWAMVLATVPVDKQEQAFRTMFEDAQQPDYVDQRFQKPFYGLLDIERAEVSRTGEVGQWQPVPLTAFLNYAARWVPTEVPEVADPDHTDMYLTMPLLPLLDRPWGLEAKHPDIPENLMGMGMDGMEGPGGMYNPAGPRRPGQPQPGQQPLQPEEMEQPEVDIRQLDPFAGPTAGGIMGPGAGYEDPTMGGGGRSGRTGRLPIGRGQGQFGDGMGPEYGGMDGYNQQQKIIGNLMVRFFDLSVVPGKQYQYRVRLTVGNPNYQVAPQFLQDPASTELQSRKTEWSAPSPVVKIPSPHQVYALAADVVRGETRAKVGMVSFHRKFQVPDSNESRPAEAARELDLEVGDVAAILADAEINHPVLKTSEKVKGFHFGSNMLLADVRGGEMVSRISEPAELLFMDADGNLTVHYELQDSGTYQETKTFLEPLPAGSAYGGNPEDMMFEDPSMMQPQNRRRGR